MSRIYLKSLFIKNFKGMKGPITINFEKNNSFSSFLIWGENASGKSSILDAIEFVIKGTMHNLPVDDPNLIKFIHENELPYVKIIFSNETSITRRFEDSGKMIVTGDGLQHIIDYSYPFIFRRSDVLTFLDAPDGKKLLLFKNFIGNDNELSYLNVKKINEIIEEIKRKKGLIRSEIALLIDTDISNIPNDDSKQFSTWKTKLFSMLYNDEQFKIEIIDPIIELILITTKDISRSYRNDVDNTVRQKHLNKLHLKRNNAFSKLALLLDVQNDDIPNKSYDFYKWQKFTLEKLIDKRGKLGDINSDVLISKVDELSKLIKKQHEIKQNRKFISEDASINPKLKLKLIDSFQEIETWIIEQFVLLSKDEMIKSLRIDYSTTSDISLTLIVEFKSGQNASPLLILSEANLDLLGILFYLGMVKITADRKSAKLLILDDIFQSIDSQIRFNSTRMIKEQFHDYQIIITTHDRLWWEQLSNSFRSAKGQFIPIKLISYPELKGHIISDQESNIKIELSDNIETEKIASTISLLMEEICYYLSLNIEISVIRKKDDKYNLGDIWPGLQKKLKHTEIYEIVAELNDFLLYRNIMGAHFNEWAMNIPRTDIIQYAKLVENLFQSTYCSNCGNWIKKSNTSDCLYICKCTNTKLKKK